MGQTKKEKIFFALMFLPLLILDGQIFTTDIYFEYEYGKAILQNGFIKEMVGSVHHFKMIPQQWLFDILAYIIYGKFGYIGCLISTMLLCVCITLIFYNILKLITNNKIKACIFTAIFSAVMYKMFGEFRPQLFSYICILLIIYLIENYIRKQKIHYLFFIPLLFVLQINIQASCWPFLICAILPYILNIKKLTGKTIIDDNYKKLPVIFSLLISLGALFINPYRLDSILYVFKGLDTNISEFISFEMQTLTIKNYGILLAIGMIILLVLFYSIKSNIKLRYLIFLIGSVLLMSLNIRSTIYFLIAFTLFVADYTKDETNTEKIIEKVFGYAKISIPILLVMFIGIRIYFIKDYKLWNYTIRGIRQTDIIENSKGITEQIFLDTTKEHPRVYSKPGIGSYLQYKGCDIYLNSGAEVFLEKENEEKDVIDEYLLLQMGRIDIKEFLDTYNFDYLVIMDSDILYDYAIKNNFELLHKTSNTYVFKTKGPE